MGIVSQSNNIEGRRRRPETIIAADYRKSDKLHATRLTSEPEDCSKREIVSERKLTKRWMQQGRVACAC